MITGNVNVGNVDAGNTSVRNVDAGNVNARNTDAGDAGNVDARNANAEFVGNLIFKVQLVCFLPPKNYLIFIKSPSYYVHLVQ